jgi:3-methyladenine DNA glycosylase AlkD
MKYYIANPVLDGQIADIRRKIRLSMNGVVSDKMTQSGIIYKKNYGVSIPRIKEIASEYQPNHDLSQRLWQLEIRETMILATLLQPIDTFPVELAHSWVNRFNQTELVEQTCMNLLSKLPYSNLFSMQCVESDKAWTQITGFVLTARIVDKLSSENIKKITEKAVALSEIDNLHLHKSIGLCLSRMSRKNKDVATYILKSIGHFSESHRAQQQYILTEVKQEISFFGFFIE